MEKCGGRSQAHENDCSKHDKDKPQCENRYIFEDGKYECGTLNTKVDSCNDLLVPDDSQNRGKEKLDEYCREYHEENVNGERNLCAAYKYSTPAVALPRILGKSVNCRHIVAIQRKPNEKRSSVNITKV